LHGGAQLARIRGPRRESPQRPAAPPRRSGARDQPPQPEEIIDAFTHPLLDRSVRGSAGWQSYFALIAKINNSPEFGGTRMAKTFARAGRIDKLSGGVCKAKR